MPSNFTEHYQLSQWEADDIVKREDFNADNLKIDAALERKGNLKIIKGTYVGTGTAGENGPTVITFPQKPLLVFICHIGTPTVGVYGMDHCYSMSYQKSLRSAWSENTLSLYDKSSSPAAAVQLNTAGETYHYIAFVET